MLLAAGTAIWVAAAVAVGAAGVGVAVRRAQQKRLLNGPWKSLRNNMTPDEVRGLLGEPRTITPLETGETWDYGRTPHTATVLFTDGRVTGFIKPF